MAQQQHRGRVQKHQHAAGRVSITVPAERHTRKFYPCVALQVGWLQLMRFDCAVC